MGWLAWIWVVVGIAWTVTGVVAKDGSIIGLGGVHLGIAGCLGSIEELRRERCKHGIFK